MATPKNELLKLELDTTRPPHPFNNVDGKGYKYKMYLYLEDYESEISGHVFNYKKILAPTPNNDFIIEHRFIGENDRIKKAPNKKVKPITIFIEFPEGGVDPETRVTIDLAFEAKYGNPEVKATITIKFKEARPKPREEANKGINDI
jgi:hypothetical protein